jgi:hypothetical protein
VTNIDVSPWKEAQAEAKKEKEEEKKEEAKEKEEEKAGADTRPLLSSP